SRALNPQVKICPQIFHFQQHQVNTTTPITLHFPFHFIALNSSTIAETTGRSKCLRTMSGSNLRRRILSLFPIRRGTVTPRDLAQVTRSSSRCTRTRFWRTCWRTFLGFKELVLVCCDGFGISGLAIFVNKCSATSRVKTESVLFQDSVPNSGLAVSP
ncbi:hypothetical protein ES319_A06G052300v1, partial [Gossypium barbadense]